jgi:hypothetical protein
MVPFRKLPGLPADNDSPIVAFPREWAKERSEGLLVEFADGDGRSWIGNFRRGATSLSQATDHPNGRNAVVIADGAMWIVDPQKREAQHVWPDVEQSWLVLNPERLVVSDGRSFLCLDAKGQRWRTAPLSQRAGFDDLRLEGERLRGRAWAVVTRTWIPFTVNLESGAVYDGGDGPFETPFDFGLTAGLEQAPALSWAGERQLAGTRNLRRAAFASLLALPVTMIVLRALNKLTGAAFAFFVSGAPWTHVFWSALFCLMLVGVLLALLTVARQCPRCQNGFFVSKGYVRHGSSTQSRGTVNVLARRCQNCELPLKGA